MYVLLWILVFFVAAIAMLALAVTMHSRREDRIRGSVTLETMPRWVKELLRVNAPGSYLIFDANQRDGFLQVALTDREGDWRRVEFGLPDAAWSHDSFALAVLRLGAEADGYEVEEDPENAEVPRFLRVTIEGESEDVFERMTDLLRSAALILGFSREDTFTVSGDGRHHPDALRAAADGIEQCSRRPWIARRVAAMMRSQADELEREQDAAAG